MTDEPQAWCYAARVQPDPEKNPARELTVEVTVDDQHEPPTPEELRLCARALMEIAAEEEGQGDGTMVRSH